MRNPLSRSLGSALLLAFFFSFALPGTTYAAEYSLDSDFNTGAGFNNWVETLAIQDDGKILVGGIFSSYDGTASTRIARLNPDGSLDGTFITGTGFNNSSKAFAVQNDGKIIIGGHFTSYNGSGVNRIIRLNSDGSRDLTFNTGTSFGGGSPESLAIQDDGKILVGGSFDSYNNATTTQIVRLNPDGSLDGTFDTGDGFGEEFASERVYTIAIQDDGKILAGGQVFNTYNGAPASRIVRLNPDGSLDGTFNLNPGFNNTVDTLLIQSDGKILAGGSFTAYNGTAVNRIARLNSDGSLDASFDSGVGFDVFAVTSLAIQNDGKILAGGEFDTYDGTPVGRIARLNTDGSLDTTFDTGTGFDSYVYSLALQSDGKILAGGSFTAYNGTAASRIARLAVVPDAPDAPVGLVATTLSDTEIGLSWDVPLNDGGSPITGYKIERKIKNGSYTTIVPDTGNTDTTYLDSGLSAKTTYTYRVSAINAVGTSDPSNEASAKTNAGSGGGGGGNKGNSGQSNRE